MLFSTVALSIISCVFSAREFVYVGDQDLTQWDAEIYCTETYSIYDGHLASIHSQSQNDEVAAACVDQPGKGDGCTIGMENTKAITVGPYMGMWTDEEPVTYTNWGRNQPKFSSTTHPTVVIKPGDAPNGPGLWRVVPDVEFPFICQKDTDIEACGVTYGIVGDRLLPGEEMHTGEALVSATRKFMAVLQSDGNFVVYGIDHGQCSVNWAANIYGTEERYLVLQDDGNVVIYSDSTRAAVWASDEYNNNPGMLIMQDDGNLVAYTIGNVAYWATWFWGNDTTFQAFVNYFYEPITQAPVSIIATLIGVVMSVLLLCIYVFKHKRNKEYEPLLNQK